MHYTGNHVKGNIIHPRSVHSMEGIQRRGKGLGLARRRSSGMGPGSRCATGRGMTPNSWMRSPMANMNDDDNRSAGVGAEDGRSSVARMSGSGTNRQQRRAEEMCGGLWKLLAVAAFVDMAPLRRISRWKATHGSIQCERRWQWCACGGEGHGSTECVEPR